MLACAEDRTFVRSAVPESTREQIVRELKRSGAEILVNVAGAGFTAHLDLRTQGDRQSVTIRPQGGTDVTAVSIALRKG